MGRWPAYRPSRAVRRRVRARSQAEAEGLSPAGRHRAPRRAHTPRHASCRGAVRSRRRRRVARHVLSPGRSTAGRVDLRAGGQVCRAHRRRTCPRLGAVPGCWPADFDLRDSRTRSPSGSCVDEVAGEKGVLVRHGQRCRRARHDSVAAVAAAPIALAGLEARRYPTKSCCISSSPVIVVSRCAGGDSDQGPSTVEQLNASVVSWYHPLTSGGISRRASTRRPGTRSWSATPQTNDADS